MRSTARSRNRSSEGATLGVLALWPAADLDHRPPEQGAGKAACPRCDGFESAGIMGIITLAHPRGDLGREAKLRNQSQAGTGRMFSVKTELSGGLSDQPAHKLPPMGDRNRPRSVFAMQAPVDRVPSSELLASDEALESSASARSGQAPGVFTPMLHPHGGPWVMLVLGVALDRLDAMSVELATLSNAHTLHALPARLVRAASCRDRCCQPAEPATRPLLRARRAPASSGSTGYRADV